MDTTPTTYKDCYIAAKAHTLTPGSVRIRLIGGKNSGVEGNLDGSIQMQRTGNLRLGALLDGIGTRYISYFEVVA